MHRKRFKLTEETAKHIINACNSSLTMAIACAKLGMNKNTFKANAIKLACYRPNPGGKGTKKEPHFKMSLSEILDGKFSPIKTFVLKQRILNAKIMEYRCVCCNNTEWLGQPIPLELHHKDGRRNNHKLENLELLCPTCHSLTDTYKSKNIRNARG